MSAHKRNNLENPLMDIQKTSEVNNNINKDHVHKKSKHSTSSYTSAFVSSLNHNSHILKVTCHNVVSFVNPTKQN